MQWRPRVPLLVLVALPDLRRVVRKRRGRHAAARTTPPSLGEVTRAAAARSAAVPRRHRGGVPGGLRDSSHPSHPSHPSHGILLHGPATLEGAVGLRARSRAQREAAARLVAWTGPL